MVVFAIILVVLLFFAFLRVGVIIEYNDAGLALWLKAGFLKFAIDINENKRRKNPGQNYFRKKLSDMKPGSLSGFTDIFKVIKEMLGRVRRRLLIKQLVIYFTSGGADPAKTALMFGAANAVFCSIVPMFDRHFRIKHHDIRTAADFDSNEPGIYVMLSISISVWELIYILLAVLPIFTTANTTLQRRPDKDERKVGYKNGKRTD